MRGRAFEKNVDRLDYQAPRAVIIIKLIRIHRRIRTHPSERDDQEPAKSPRRTEQIAHHMQKSSRMLRSVVIGMQELAALMLTIKPPTAITVKTQTVDLGRRIQRSAAS